MFLALSWHAYIIHACRKTEAWKCWRSSEAKTSHFLPSRLLLLGLPLLLALLQIRMGRKKERKEGKKKGRKMEKLVPEKRLVGCLKSWWSLYRPFRCQIFYCWAAVTKQWQTDSTLDRELALA
jgi:hypothetical protein